MRGLTDLERLCLHLSLPGKPDFFLEDAGIPLGVETSLLSRGLLVDQGPVEDSPCLLVTTPMGVQLLTALSGAASP